MTAHATASAEEIAKFAALADAWWDPAGAFRPLHKFNPARLRFIRDHLARHFGRDVDADRPFAGLRLVDLGCGGGLVTEPMARLGFEVTGIDAAEENIGTADTHAVRSGLEIAYRVGGPEDLAAAGAHFDAVLALEVIEHVSDMEAFLASASALVAPGGAMIAATLNRTVKSLLLGKMAAEYLLRWVPTGTHNWRKFVRPSELVGGLRRNGLRVDALAGVSYNLAKDRWDVTDDIGVNYMLFARKT